MGFSTLQVLPAKVFIMYLIYLYSVILPSLASNTLAPFSEITKTTDTWPSSINTQTSTRVSITTTENIVFRNTSEYSVFLNTYNYNQTVTNRMLSVDGTTLLCGSSRLCNYTLPKKAPGVCTFECSKCYCDDDCHFYGDCCADKLFQFSEQQPSIKPDYVSCVGKEKKKFGNLSHIFMVTDCPVTNNVDNDTITKCRFMNESDLQQATPVSANSTNLTYSNVFCARCHGIKSYKSWTHTVNCSAQTALQGARSREELWRLIVASCYLIQSLPPDGFEIRPCEQSVINRCNVTGRWEKNVDPIMEDLCALYRHPALYYRFSRPDPAYANIFCAICNGADIGKPPCSRGKNLIPPPISVLLQFNPSNDQDENQKAEGSNISACTTGFFQDPFLKTCKSIRCPARRVLIEDRCEVLYVSSHALGFSYSHWIQSSNLTLIADENFLEAYTSIFKNFFEDLIPFFHLNITLELFGELSDYSTEKIWIRGEFITKVKKPVTYVEQKLNNFTSLSWTYETNSTNETVVSIPATCPSINDQKETGYELLYNVSYTETEKKVINITFSGVTLNCPHLEYDLTTVNFTFNTTSNTIQFMNSTIHVDKSQIAYCGGYLRICIEALSTINITMEELFYTQTRNNDYDLALQIVSFVCIIASIVALFLTFFLHCLLARLRTAPGKTMMALVFHLFWAHLLFLSLSNIAPGSVQCQVFAISIHYFCVTTFAWMMASAFQMYRVFSSFQAMARNQKSSPTFIWKYLLICDLSSVIPVVACVVYYHLTSQGTDLGYGKYLCFLNEAWAIGVFFAAPVCLMLAFNAFCFTRTLLTVGCQPRIENSAMKSMFDYLFVYVKLSVLLGFSWSFGLLAAIFDSNVLWYFFVILTGCQGLFIFIGYCINRRNWSSLKVALAERSSTVSSRLSRRST